MATTLFEAKPYDPRRERRRRNIIILAIVAALVIAGILWWLRFWPEKRAVSHFFQAVQQQELERAYAIWMADPNWKQHPDRYARYPFGQFSNDWGPGGEWGIVKDFKVEGAAQAPPTSFSASNFVVVVVTVNGRTDKACIAVQKSDKSMGFSPYDEVKVRTQQFDCK